MKERKPLKRHEALKPVSREHHHGLLLSWKLREGFKYDIDMKRMKKYVDWFWKEHLKPHFEFEEKYVFPILGSSDKLVLRALEEHKRLAGLFNSNDKIRDRLEAIQKELTDHIRFEERILFDKLQEQASEDELEMLAESHQLLRDPEGWEDQFWVRE